MTGPLKPTAKPARPFFSSGPCAKPPGWSPAWLADALTGRSHRSAEGLAAIADLIAALKRLLRLPEDYRLAIVPGSDTGAFEMAMWSLLGERGTDVLAWDVFGRQWVRDVTDELRLADVRLLEAEFGRLPDLAAADFSRDVVFTANGTTSGVRVPHFDWIAPDRTGLTLCDATSAVFAQDMDWPRLDVTTFSFQKCLGGEAAHGVLILSPRAIERARSYAPPRPVPKLFRFARDGRLDEKLFAGETINTPSMLCIADCARAVAWADEIGGLDAMLARAKRNAGLVQDWLAASRWAVDPVADPSTRSLTSVTIALGDPRAAALGDKEQRRLVGDVVQLLEEEGAGFDIGGHRAAPPSLRIWTGPTVEEDDLKALLPWLDWAYETIAADRLRS